MVLLRGAKRAGRSARPERPCRSRERERARARAFLHEGWVIANHVLVSFHVAFLSSVLVLPAETTSRGEVLRFVFLSSESLVSALFLYLSFHAGIALHEMGHFLTAARLNALSDDVQPEVQRALARSAPARWLWYARVFLLAPWGRAHGIRREGLSYYPDAPYNLAVAAAGPRASRNACLATLPLALLLVAFGLATDGAALIQIGRPLLGVGVVTLLDFLLADPGKYRAFRARERRAAELAGAVRERTTDEGWLARAPAALARLRERRMSEALHPRLGAVRAPWQFRNCGMGGRHTEKEYPESNISMQEAMFLILGASDTNESQETTVRLQGRLREILSNEEGCRVMGIGLEGGLAPYVDRGSFELPELRLWSLMKRAIEECGLRPGVDVAIALDPAMSELEIAYREEFGIPDAVGSYLFWRDQARTVLDRDGVLALYERAVRELDVPILSIEDGFSEHDHEGWRRLRERLGERLLVIGDDLVTTNDRVIERAADDGLVNAALIKANQIGTLSETLLAVLVALGKGLEVVVSHRSKSPNDDMEAHVALAVNALGLKAGGGANTERLVKYDAVARMMRALQEPERGGAPRALDEALVRRITAAEEPTNAGIPTVGCTVELELPAAGVRLSFRGATPLGTSAGTGEAVHLVDRTIERAERRELVERHAGLFREVEPGVVEFAPELTAARVAEVGDAELTATFERVQRYDGKGCLTAAANVRELLAPVFEGRDIARSGLFELDRALLEAELRVARRRGKLGPGASAEEVVALLQRKQNLGMNAVLACSLALARALAHVRGMELFELLREELLRIVARIAEEHGVPVAGGRFEDYVAALRGVASELERRGVLLHEALRRTTGIYALEGSVAPAPRRAAPEPPPRRPARASAPEPASAPTPAPEALEPAALVGAEELADLAELALELARAYAPEAEPAARPAALRRYLETKTRVARRTGRFEIVNNRLLRSAQGVLVPYLVDDALLVMRVDGARAAPLAPRRFPRGTIFTDRMLAESAGVETEPVDLEPDLFEFDPSDAPGVRSERVRDLVALLERLNATGGRDEVVYHLRFAVARLCSLSFQGFLGAKNLQPEARRLAAELARFLNGPFGSRLRLPLRVLVRNVSGLLLRPKLIDEVWNDTIELSEVHLRGSAIANELRRSAHHALGLATLRLAKGYRAYLLEGGSEELPPDERDALNAVDAEARERKEPRVLVERVVSNLEELLGTSQIAIRVEEWMQGYSETLLRCESGAAFQEVLEDLATRGIHARNRWSYHHHLRVLARKAGDGAWADSSGADFAARLAALEQLQPDAPGFDPEEVEGEVQAAAEAFAAALEVRCAKPLFDELRALLADFRAGSTSLDVFLRVGAVRAELESWLSRGEFREQRYLLVQLDCLLEEMGYLCLRHVAASFDERGVDLRACACVVQQCAENLEHDGLFSRELWDLGCMLVDERKSSEQQRDLLAGVQRCYLMIVRRFGLAYEAMAPRLGLDERGLRIMQANLQRYMHDLNSVAQFADLARTHLQAAAEDGAPDGVVREPDSDGEAFDFLHLSHAEELSRRVESRRRVPNLLDRYGGKGSGLAYLSYLRIPTRDGFVIPTTLGRLGLHRSDPERFARELQAHLCTLEQDISRARGAPVHFGDCERPLLLAARGGSAFSMPGMLSTVVFVGLTDAVTAALAEEDAWHAWDAQRRFLVTFAGAAWGIDLEAHDLVEEAKRRHGVRFKAELPGEAMHEVVEGSKAILRRAGHGEELETLLADPERQLVRAVEVVLESWDAPRARSYRRIRGLSERWHTAVIVQEMACGNRRGFEIGAGMDERRASLTGVIPRTRMTETGFRCFTGDFKFHACGDDLVGGMTAATSFQPVQGLHELMPMLERQLQHLDAKIRRFRGTDPEIEFTVDRGVLSVLQARMAPVGLGGPEPAFEDPGPPLSRGIGVRGGAFRGRIAFDEEDLRELRARPAEPEVDGVLLVLENPAPDQIPLVLSADALLTARGGSSSHTAVAVQSIDDRRYSAVLSAAGLRVDARRRQAVLRDAEGLELARIEKGDVVSLHGTSGEVYLGTRRLHAPTACAPEPERDAAVPEAT